MKKLNILIHSIVLFIPLIALGKSNIDTLEYAVRESDVNTVRIIINSAPISQSEQKRLLVVAEDILQQRRSLYVIIPTNKQSLTLVGGISLLWFVFFCITEISDSLIPIKLSLMQIDKNYKNYVTKKWADCHWEQDFFCLISMAGYLIIPTVIIKHFYDIIRLYYNAISIKSLLYGAIIQE